MKLIVGLGNPGKEYEKTHHNIGFIVIDDFALLENFPKYKSGFLGLYSEKTIEGEKVIIFKPTTYMNLSGNAIAEISNFYKIPPTDILIIHDDLDLPFAKLRLRYTGSAGGHNGMKSIISALNSNDLCRVRIGIGRPVEDNTIDYVLSKFSKSELNTLHEMEVSMKDIIYLFVRNNFLKAMNMYNVNKTDEGNN